jgi:hypothetical protein
LNRHALRRATTIIGRVLGGSGCVRTINVIDAAVAELREIANGRGDLLAERAGVTLDFYARENRDE